MSRPLTFPREIRTFVSPECIRKGVARDGDNCPIGWSLRGRFNSVYVSTRYAWVCPAKDFAAGAWAWYILDDNAQEFIKRFDVGLEVQPIVLSLLRVHVYRF